MRILRSIPHDPVPSKTELAAELRKLKKRMHGASSEIMRNFAELCWAASKREAEPNLFWWPFAPTGYDSYLISDQWRKISRQIKREAGNKCACCPNKAAQVHHRCYRPRVMSGEDTSLLIALCRVCHKTVDFDEKGKVRDAHSKERVLAELFDGETKRLVQELGVLEARR